MLLTSNSDIDFVASKMTKPIKKQDTRFLESLSEVTNGMEPICQSCDRVTGHKIIHQLNAAK